MSKAILIRRGDTAIPADEDSLAVLRGFKDGAEFIAECRGERNIHQLKLFWALAGIVANSADVPKETIKRRAAFALGFTEAWLDLDGTIRFEAMSIAVESMTQAVFDEFFRKAVEVMAGWISADHKDLMRRFNELASDKRYEGMRHG